MIKKIFVILPIGLLFAFQVQAVALVPKNAPLQPMPEDITPNISNNINSENSESNKSLEEQQPVESTTDADENDNSDNNGSPTLESPISGTIPESGGSGYWVMLIVGVVGLIGILGWWFWRFSRNR